LQIFVRYLSQGETIDNVGYDLTRAEVHAALAVISIIRAKSTGQCGP
jgi:hypothetical protein